MKSHESYVPFVETGDIFQLKLPVDDKKKFHFIHRYTFEGKNISTNIKCKKNCDVMVLASWIIIGI